MSDGCVRFASKLEDAIDAVHRANQVRLEEDILNFGDLNLILAELHALYERARTMRFAHPSSRDTEGES